jgi:phage shock protein A
MADQHGAKIMNFNELRRKALAFLESAKDNSLLLKMTEENAKLQTQIKGLETRLADNDTRFEQLQRQLDATNPDSADSPRRRK